MLFYSSHAFLLTLMRQKKKTQIRSSTRTIDLLQPEKQINYINQNHRLHQPDCFCSAQKCKYELNMKQYTAQPI